MARTTSRSAIAICVACRKPICQACSTLWEGIHHCTACLAQRRAAVGRRGTTMSAWQSDHGGPLSYADVRDLIAHLRSWSKEPIPEGTRDGGLQRRSAL